MKGPGTWIVNLAFYKDIVRTQGVTVEVTALLDNAFNHPQFFVPSLGTLGFVDLTDFLLNGDLANGTTGVLGADTVGNSEGFSVRARGPLRPAHAFLISRGECGRADPGVSRRGPAPNI